MRSEFPFGLVKAQFGFSHEFNLDAHMFPRVCLAVVFDCVVG